MRARLVGTRLVAVAALAALGGGFAAASVPSQMASAADGSTGSSVVKVPTFTLPLTKVGQVNLSSVAQSERTTPVASQRQGSAISKSAVEVSSARYREVDNAIHSHALKGRPVNKPNPATRPLSTMNVPGETGSAPWAGSSRPEPTGGGPRAARPGFVRRRWLRHGVHQQRPCHLQRVRRATGRSGRFASAFLQPTTDFFSDPRCYYDAPTKRWFFQEFIVGAFNSSGKLITPSTQFEAVSNTADPTSTYTVYSWNTTRRGDPGLPLLR